MPVDFASLGIENLTVRQRLDLIEFIWATLPEQVSSDELPPSHVAELQRRRRGVA